MAASLKTLSAYDPRAKLDVQDNSVFLTGTQALVRVVLEQMRRDAAARLRTAAFVSGYPGSPLGTFDLELGKHPGLLRDLGITHLPGHNEELAATSVYGSQMAQTFPDARYDGVLGVWYGKGPGLDRATDAIRHGQYVGTSRHGGVLAFVGDDPGCKSSSIPNSAEHTLQDLGVPTLAPASVQDILELGPHGVALSRLSGLWTGFRVVTDVADGTATVAGAVPDPEIVVPDVDWGGQQFTPSLRGVPGPPWSIDVEAELRGPRLTIAREYGYLNQLNRITLAPSRARVSVVAVGHLYLELRSALRKLGLDDATLFGQGIRLCHVRMQHPLDPRTLHEFSADVDQVIVVEEKRPVVERLLREVRYRSSHQPVIVGKEDAAGRGLIPPHGAVHADELVRPLHSQLSRFVGPENLREPEPHRVALPIISTARSPYFCSGCPHNSSTKVPDGAVVGGGIGCHGMTQLMDPMVVGNIASTTHMGSEGAQWFGIDNYVATDHMFQNLGDGTYFHSGQLAIQAAVAAKAHITYKLLYNDAIAMTGGQSAAESNALSVPDVAEILSRQGVSRIIITTDNPRGYRRVKLPQIVQVWDRTRVVEAQEELRNTEGVTVLIHDQRCAAENRRDRKRKKMPMAEQKVVINERMCEGCGDCGVKSNCLSVEPVETEYGRKTQINQTTCNADFSCLQGDCPSFVTIKPAPRAKSQRATTRSPLRPSAWQDGWLEREPPAPPTRTEPKTLTIRMPGIGGTGVVTASQIIGTAAMFDGKVVHGMDQTGLSQKAGPVISDLTISAQPSDTASRAVAETVDLLLGFDLMVAGAAATQESLCPGRTVAVISTTRTPTGEMVSNVNVAYPDTRTFAQELEATLGRENVHWVDATEITQRLFDDSASSNVFLIGMAVQTGGLNVSVQSLEAAIEMNGVAVHSNLAAFRAGRWWVADPARFGFDATGPATPADCWFSGASWPPVILSLAEQRAADLEDYQNRRYAQQYVRFVRSVGSAEQAAAGEAGALTMAVARNLYKLMAYKDEYEIARLSFDPAERARIARVAEAYGPGARVYWNLHPPVLRDHGMKNKLRLGAWFTPAFRILRSMRKIRGTRFDPFGRTEVRRLERALVAEYKAAINEVLPHLGTHSLTDVIALAELPDGVRGYEQLKLDSGRRFLAALNEQRASIISRADQAPTAAPEEC